MKFRTSVPKTMGLLRLATLTAALLASTACNSTSTTTNSTNPIVGAWFVRDTAAPFQYHMYVFNADGTMQQANPDAGDANTSDSDGKGIWVADADKVRGKFVEVTASRATHQFVSRGEISFELKVTGDKFTGTGTARFYDAGGTLMQGPIQTSPMGERVTLP